MKPAKVLAFPASPHSPETQILRAKMQAKIAHGGDRNQKNGELYILHPERVAGHAVALCLDAGLSREDYAIVLSGAWLHDTVEDTKLTLEMLEALGFAPEVIEVVDLLTRVKGVPDEVYYARIAAHRLARLVKLADLADNTDPKRMAGLTETDRARLKRKYTKAYRALNAQVPAHLLAA